MPILLVFHLIAKGSEKLFLPAGAVYPEIHQEIVGYSSDDAEGIAFEI